MEFRGFPAIQSDKSIALLYNDEVPSEKYKVTPPTISIAPGGLSCVEKPRTAMFVKLPGLVNVKMAPVVGQIVALGLAWSRFKPPYAPSPNV